MKRLALLLLLLVGFAKVPLEQRIGAAHRAAYFHGAKLDLSLREQISQESFMAALGGFRGIVADALAIKANTAWENTQWARVIFLYNQITTLQPRSLLHWETAANYTASDAAAAAVRGSPITYESGDALLLNKEARAFLQQGREFLERGIANNPDRYLLYNRLGALLMNKMRDYPGAAEAYDKAAQFPDCMGYEKRFAAYALSRVPGREREAYERLMAIYRADKVLAAETLRRHPGDPHVAQRMRGFLTPTLLLRIKAMEEALGIPVMTRIPEPAPGIPGRE